MALARVVVRRFAGTSIVRISRAWIASRPF
jgi:hypothetical protein